MRRPASQRSTLSAAWALPTLRIGVERCTRDRRGRETLTRSLRKYKEKRIDLKEARKRERKDEMLADDDVEDDE